MNRNGKSSALACHSLTVTNNVTAPSGQLISRLSGQAEVAILDYQSAAQLTAQGRDRPTVSPNYIPFQTCFRASDGRDIGALRA